MSRADYAHWNEEQDMVWWAEEGKHSFHVDNYDPELDDDYLNDERRDDYECDEQETEQAESNPRSG